MPERREGRHRKIPRQRGREQEQPREPERGDPRGKPFVMLHSGHETEDIPALPEVSRLVGAQLDMLPRDQKVLLYVEDFSGDEMVNDQLSALMARRGMTLTQAMDELEFQSLPRWQRRESKRPEAIARLRRERNERTKPFQQEVTAHIDTLLDLFGRRLEVRFEKQPPEVVEGNRRFFDELHHRFPADTTDGEIVATRRAQLEDWAATQKTREENVSGQIVGEMSRTDIGAGVSLLGAWHYGGVDPRLREALAPEDDPRATNVVSLFPETRLVKMSHGRVQYPVDPEIALVRELINGRQIGDLDILLAYRAGEINFGDRTAEEVILETLGEDADRFLPEPEAPTEELPVVSAEEPEPDETPTESFSLTSPQVEGAEEAAKRQRWVALMKGMMTKTVRIPAIHAERERQLQREMEEQARERPEGERTIELRVGEPTTINVPVTPSEADVEERYLGEKTPPVLPDSGEVFERYNLGTDVNNADVTPPQEQQNRPPTHPPHEIDE